MVVQEVYEKKNTSHLLPWWFGYCTCTVCCALFASSPLKTPEVSLFVELNFEGCIVGKPEFGWLIRQLWRLDFIWTNIHKCSLLVLKTKDYSAALWWLFYRILLRYAVLIIAWGAAACVRGITSGFDIPAWPRRDLFQTNFPLVFLRIFCLVSKYKKPEADLSGFFLFFPKQTNTSSPLSAHPITAVCYISRKIGVKGKGEKTKILNDEDLTQATHV